MEKRGEEEEEDGEEIVCIDRSFFINDDYQLTTFTFGSQVLQLFCLQSASTDFDLTGQLVWPGAKLLNNYISQTPEMLRGCSVIELGSGVGVTGILCSKFCHDVVLTDHNEEVLKILKKNIELHSSSESTEKLEWGNSHDLNQILERHPEGFDLVLGADISFNSLASPCFLILCNSFSALGISGTANSCWLMYPEPKSWMPWLSVKLLGMDC
ncbi:uncharacterized protein LOC127795913 isoform X2 [Diospyros lotus]|uniref:uncharacterized protein LOC127795913 isoform X2 n=1 Tax=Diospyros lotus TaxID=55363 RepID=UPI0022590F6F|nr:uncharacterized protein LOC127795913 isoform X2 [Diospyros lotus]